MNRMVKLVIPFLIIIFILTSCIQKTLEPNKPPSTPQNKYPSQSELIFQNTFKVQWTNSQDPEGEAVTYAIKFAQSLNELEESNYEHETTNNTFQMENLETGIWFWQIKASDPKGNSVESVIWDFTVSGDDLPQPENPGDIPPDPVLLVSNIQDTSFDLDWEPYRDVTNSANQITYRIDLYKEGTESPVRSLEKGYYRPRKEPTQTGQSTETYFSFTGLSNNTLYYWIILALNNASQTSIVGSSMVKTGNHPPSFPELLSPQKQAIDIDVTSSLRWTESTDPDDDILRYYVFLDTFKNSPSVATPEGLTETAYKPDLMVGTSYYWRVLVKDGNGGAAISSLGSFSTANPNGLSYPTAPLPADNAQSTDPTTPTTLIWQHDGTGNCTYTILFGTNPKNMIPLAQGLTEKNYTIQGFLKGKTWYFWQIKVIENDSGESVIGPQWQFKTTKKDPPIQIKAQTNETGDKIELSYNKPMADPTGKHEQFNVERLLSQNDRSRQNIPINDIELLAGFNNRFLLTLSEGIATGDIITISYTKGDVQSLDGAYLESYEATEVNNRTKGASPVCLEAVITEEGETIELGFNKSMAEPEATTKDQFLVEVNGTSIPLTSVGLKPDHQEVIILTLGTPLGKNNNITVSYIKGTIQSSDGGILDSFQDKAVDQTQLSTLWVMKDIAWNYSTVNNAINAAESGDTIIISEGTYNEAINLLDKELHIKGTNPDDMDVVANTVIDAQGQGTNTVTIAGGQTHNTVIEGLTITGGAIETGGSSQRISLHTESGIYIKEANPRIRKNIITGNGSVTTHTGRGIYIESASPKIHDNIITNNNTSDFGGGILVYSPPSPASQRPVASTTQPWIYANTIENNVAYKGGGIYVEVNASVFNSNGDFWRRFNSFPAPVTFTENTTNDNNTYSGNTSTLRPTKSNIIFREQTTPEGLLTIDPRVHEQHETIGMDVNYAVNMALYEASMSIHVPTGFTITGNASVIIDTDELPAGHFDFTAQMIEITPITTTEKVTVTLRLEETQAPTGTSARKFLSRDNDYTFTAKIDADGTDTAWRVSDTSRATFTAIIFSNTTNITLKESVDYLSITDAPTKVYYLPDTTVGSLTSMLEAPDGSSQNYTVKTVGGSLNPQDSLPNQATLTVLAEDGTTEQDYGIYSAEIKLATEAGEKSLHRTLQEAVDAADTTNANWITLCTDTVHEGAEVVIDSGKEITIQSEDGDRAVTVIDGATSHRLFNLSGGASVTFKDLEMRNGKPDNGTKGGAIQAEGMESLTFMNCLVHTNEASTGGGLFVKDTTIVTIENSEFEQNVVNEIFVSGGGGGIFANNVEIFAIEKCVFDQNSVNDDDGDGGAIYWLSDHDLIIANSTITNNQAADDGGAIYSKDGNTLIAQSLISSNTAGGKGGAIWSHNDAVVEINASSIESNTAYKGGGLFIKGSLILTDSTVASNTTTEDEGGGIFIESGDVDISGSEIRANTAPYAGGGLYVENSVSTITNSEITQNSASNDEGGFEGGGGGAMIYNSRFTTYDSNYTWNETTEDGGGIYVTYNSGAPSGYKTVVDVQRCHISNNNSEKRGGGIVMSGCTSTIQDSQICENEAGLFGGGFYSTYADNTFDHCLIDSNSMITADTQDQSGGGGICVTGLFDGLAHETLILNSTITNNTTDHISANTENNGAYGGGLYAKEASVTIENSTVENNTSGYAGGGVANYSKDSDSYMTVKNCVIRSNETGEEGGGIYNGNYTTQFVGKDDESHIKVSDSLITDNTSNKNGGGIIAYDSHIILENSTITSNNTTERCGGVGLRSFDDICVATVTFNDILSNEADIGAGIYINDRYSDDWFSGTIYGNNIRDNAADTQGGGIYIYNRNAPAVFNTDGDAWFEFDCPASDTEAVEGNNTPANNNDYSGNMVDSSDTAIGADIEFES